MKLALRKLFFVVLLTVIVLYCVYINYVKTKEGFFNNQLREIVKVEEIRLH